MVRPGAPLGGRLQDHERRLNTSHGHQPGVGRRFLDDHRQVLGQGGSHHAWCPGRCAGLGERLQGRPPGGVVQSGAGEVQDEEGCVDRPVQR